MNAARLTDASNLPVLTRTQSRRSLAGHAALRPSGSPQDTPPIDADIDFALRSIHHLSHMNQFQQHEDARRLDERRRYIAREIFELIIALCNHCHVGLREDKWSTQL
jgi:hypothetical protein